MIRIILKRQIKKIWKIFFTMLSILGALVAIGDAIDEIFHYDGLFQFYRQHVRTVMSIVFLISIKINWDNLKYTVKIKGSPDVSVTLKVCDALKNDGAVVIPTNSTFDTTMKDDFISPKSLQGQYQLKYYKESLLELDHIIAEGLKDKKYIDVNDGRTTKTKRYPIGTVCRVSEEYKKRAYFLVDSDVNERGIPESTDVSDITRALVSLWEALNIIGNMEPYSIPVLGTGKAGVKNASRDEVVKQIVISFLAATREYKITENLTICIHHSDFDKVHWDELCDFVKFQCSFSDHKIGVNIIGREEKISNKVELQIDNVDYDFDFGDISEESHGKYEKRADAINEFEYYDTTVSNTIIRLLNGNQLKISEIAEAIGLSVISTKQLVQNLQKKGKIQVVGGSKIKKYTKA